ASSPRSLRPRPSPAFAAFPPRSAASLRLRCPGPLPVPRGSVESASVVLLARPRSAAPGFPRSPWRPSPPRDRRAAARSTSWASDPAFAGAPACASSGCAAARDTLPWPRRVFRSFLRRAFWTCASGMLVALGVLRLNRWRLDRRRLGLGLGLWSTGPGPEARGFIVSNQGPLGFLGRDRPLHEDGVGVA